MRKFVAGALAGIMLAAPAAMASSYKLLRNGETMYYAQANALCKTKRGILVCSNVSAGKTYQIGISKSVVAIGRNGKMIWHRYL